MSYGDSCNCSALFSFDSDMLCWKKTKIKAPISPSLNMMFHLEEWDKKDIFMKNHFPKKKKIFPCLNTGGSPSSFATVTNFFAKLTCML